MKKLIVFILVMMLAVPVFATSYEIMTDRGKQEVVVPDGYDPLDVLLIIAQNYYNLNYKYEEIVIDYEKLTDKANSYIEANNQLRANLKTFPRHLKICQKNTQRLQGLTL